MEMTRQDLLRRCMGLMISFSLSPQEETEPEEPKQQFLNRYQHCGEAWEEVWSCQCNDKCPVCGVEIEPYKSEVTE